MAALLPDQLDRNPDQQRAADNLQERDPQQEGRDEDEKQPEADGAGRTPEPPVQLLARGKATHGERDDQRVVAGQREVDDDDAQQAREELRGEEVAHDRVGPRFT
jgi:hypothetical protein